MPETRSVRSPSLTTTVYYGTLIDEYGIEETGKFKKVMNSDDILSLAHHFWALYDAYYPDECQQEAPAESHENSKTGQIFLEGKEWGEGSHWTKAVDLSSWRGSFTDSLAGAC